MKQRRWYAVQHGDDDSRTVGSTQKQEAFKIAHAMAKEFPTEEIRVVFCYVGDAFANHVVIVRPGSDENPAEGVNTFKSN